VKRAWFGLPEHPWLWMKHSPTHLGRRGGVLLILGVIWFFIGISTIADPYPNGVRNQGLFHEALPSWLRATLWIGTSAVALSSAWRVAGRRDDWGYMALILMPTVRAMSYLWAWLIHLIPGPPDGAPTGWLGFIVWGTVTILVYTISGWPETPKFVPPETEAAAHGSD